MADVCIARFSNWATFGEMRIYLSGAVYSFLCVCVHGVLQVIIDKVVKT